MNLLSMFKKAPGPNRTEGQSPELAANSSCPPQTSAVEALPARGSLSTPPPAPSPVKDNRLLFAGIPLPRFRQIETSLNQLQPSWECLSTSDGTQTLATLSSGYFDLVVLDGALIQEGSFVQQLAEKSPRSLRLVLGDARVATQVPQPLRPRMEFLPADSDPQTLVENIRRGLLVERWMAEPSMRRILSMIRRLPTLPKIHMQIIDALRDPAGTLEQVSSLVAQDPVMAAKFLQIVNSACFGISYTIADPAEAVMFLGVERTRGLVLMAGVFSQFDGVRCPDFSVEQTWDHSLRVGMLARGITLLEVEDSKLAEMAFTAGLLHEIGNLVLAANLPDMYTGVRKLQAGRQVTLTEAEREILGVTSAELGACLLGTWKLPVTILQALAWHGTPGQSPDTQFSLLTAVHAANVLAQETLRESGLIDQPERFDLAYLARLGLGARRSFWREGCGLPTGIETDTCDERIRRQRDAKNN
jgi:HD-like signal output (HDOD) protein